MTLASTVLLAAATQLMAQSVTSEPIGFNKVTCLNNSDTIVGVPFRSQGSRNSKLAAAPVVNGDVATLTLTATNLPLWPGHSRYVKFNSGTKEGRYYDITSNTDTTITLDLNGDTLGDATTGDALVIAEYWTLGTLFPASGATTAWTETPAASGNWVQNGHAVVSSNSYSLLARRTEILLPNLTTAGINLTPASVHFISGTTTKTWTEAKTGGSFVPSGSTILNPDTYFIIRHAAAVARPTTFRSVGEVEAGSVSIPLATSTSVKWDNQVAIPRPLPVKLSELGLAGTSAFVSSNSISLLARRDELFVFDNLVALKNRTPSAVYFVIGGNWQKMVNNLPVVANDDVIQAGHGLIIRKYKSTTGQTVFWDNHPTF